MMVERKPPGMDVESWVEKQIREAQQRGDFDDLAGAGKSLSGVDRDWLSTYLEREGLSAEPVLPEPLRLRRELERLPDTLAAVRDETEVRRVVRELNLRIAEWMRSGDGPRVHVAPVDVEEVVARWRASRPTAGRAGTGAAPSAGAVSRGATSGGATSGGADPGGAYPGGADPADAASGRGESSGSRGGRRPWWRRRRSR